MYAIIDIAGKQFKVSKNDKIITPRLSAKVGDKVEFDKVLFIAGEKTSQVGTPVIESAKIEGTILTHGRDKKVIVFKKKRRKGYKVKNGHRQPNSTVQITNIIS